MTAVVGLTGVLLALVSALTLAVRSIRAIRHPEVGSRSSLRGPVWGIAVGATLAMGTLLTALVTHDFSIAYVADNHARATPLIFTLASSWAALEGSIVLWALVLSGYIAFVFRSVRSGDVLGLGALAVLAVVAIFFFGLIATFANPFEVLETPPLDGRGPNGLLQNNLLMAVHPPLLYLGFVGLTVPYAFGISALALKQPGSVWLERTRRTALVGWSFLTAGIVMGAFWSYSVLGWGGYWSWDPVENASFLPWLAATAFIHSAVVQRRRGMLTAWNVSLVISTFALTILGTFLTRSGVVASVHSFTQSAVGPILLGFLVIIIVGSFGLLAYRAHLVGSVPRLESLASREGVFLFNNLLLTLFAFVVLIGTIYPILLEAFTGDQVSVGRPFFDRATVPIALLLLLAMGVGPITPYRLARASILRERLRLPLRTALVVAALAVALGLRHAGVTLVLWLGVFVTAVIVRHLWYQATRAKRDGERGLVASAWRLARRDPGYWGGQVAHIGIAIIAVAITISSVYAERAELSLDVGESADFADYTITYVEPFARDERHRTVIGATIEVERGGQHIATLRPSLNTYGTQSQAISTPALRVGLTEDLYLSLSRINTSGISVDVFRNPIMWFLWLGGLVVMAGSAWSLTERRRAREHAVVRSDA